MDFNPAKPADSSPLSSQEMRDQLNALKALIDTQAARISALEQQLPGMALMPSMDPFDLAFHDPPTTSDLGAIQDWMNNVLGELKGSD